MDLEMDSIPHSEMFGHVSHAFLRKSGLLATTLSLGLSDEYLVQELEVDSHKFTCTLLAWYFASHLRCS